MGQPPRRSTGKSPYITEDGHARLREELDGLWVKRREVVSHLSAAAAEGDRSENAEYIYRKKELREIDRRVRYLQRRLPELEVVRRPPGDSPDRVYFGATVDLMDEDGTESTYRIVGADEFDPARNWISIDSPVARALIKRGIDEEVMVNTPSGQRLWVVVDVRY